MIRVAPLLLAALLAACAGDEEAPPAEAPAEGAVSALPAELEGARQANGRFEDVSVALSEGYMEDPTGMCVAAADVGAPAEQGAMGIHYLSPAHLGVQMPPGGGPPPAGARLSGTDATIDPERPEVLVYEPTADGGRQLVALEYMVFAKAWSDAGHTEPPSLAGQEFYLMEDDPATGMDEAHGFEPHWELHVWTHRDNPNGVFAEFNPAVTCPATAAGHAGASD